MTPRIFKPWANTGSPPLTHIALTLLVAWLAARLCLALAAPLPWMIGPLLASAALAMAGGPAASWTPFRNAGQWVIAVALGLYFTPQVVGLIASLWWAIALRAWGLEFTAAVCTTAATTTTIATRTLAATATTTIAAAATATATLARLAFANAG